MLYYTTICYMDYAILYYAPGDAPCEEEGGRCDVSY